MVRVPRSAVAALVLIAATGFIPPTGTVVQMATSGTMQVVVSKQLLGAGTDGRQFFQWYVSAYRLVHGTKPVQEWTADNPFLSNVTQAGGGAKLWFPIQTATIVGFARLMPGSQPQAVVQTHEMAADCGTARVAVLHQTNELVLGAAYDEPEKPYLTAVAQNSCSLTAAIVRGKNGAPDTLVLHGPYYAKNAPLCCPTQPDATATLAYGNGAWSISPQYYQLHTTESADLNYNGEVWANWLQLRDWLPSLGAPYAARWGGTGGLDYFICPNQPIATVPYRAFGYAVSGCLNLAHGTSFRVGVGDDRVQALYDAAHKIVLYSLGCCSVESFIVTAGIGAPPKRVTHADLSGVRTKRGVRLGMSQRDVMAIYGAAKPSDGTGNTGLVVLGYEGKPPQRSRDCGGDAGDQRFSFGFRNARLVYIRIDTGC